MLKGIIEHKDFRMEILDGPLSSGHSIWIANYGSDSQQIPGEQKRLISGLPFTCQEVSAVRNQDLRVWVGFAVTPGQHAHLFAFAHTLVSHDINRTANPLNQWCLARSTGR